MIEGCIVAKLVFGYLKDEGFNRTCSTFQEECSYFHSENKEIDLVLLTADLKTILDDYSRPRETGRDNVPSTTSIAVIKSLWKELDILVGQLKYATVPSSVPKSSLPSQSVRTRRLNYVSRPTRNNRSRSQELARPSAPNVPSIQQRLSPGLPGRNPPNKLPLPRLPSNGPSQNQLLQSNQKQAQANTSGLVNLAGISGSQYFVQTSGSNLTFSTLPTLGHEGEACSTINNLNTRISVSSDNHESLNNDNIFTTGAAVECAFGVMDGCGLGNNKDVSNGGDNFVDAADSNAYNNEEHSEDSASVVVINEHSPPRNSTQDELLLKSPKRKCVQPKKRAVQGDANRPSVVADSPVKSGTCAPASSTQEFELLDNPAWDTTTPQFFLDKLLNTPLLQEKLAENINKVVGSSRQQPDSDNNVTITEVSSEDFLMAPTESGGADVPVEDILEKMQSDPAFDALFSLFGLDAFGDSALSRESPNELGSEAVVTSTGSIHMETSSSPSSTSNLHLSATSIVTDALLLLAGSPQKLPLPASLQPTLPSNIPLAENPSSVTPPSRPHSAEEFAGARRAAINPASLPGVIMSTVPYVRQLDFSAGKDDFQNSKTTVNKGVRKKGCTNKKVTQQRKLKDNTANQSHSKRKGSAGQSSFTKINKRGSDVRAAASSSKVITSDLENRTIGTSTTQACSANTNTGSTPSLVNLTNPCTGPTPPSVILTNLTTVCPLPPVSHTNPASSLTNPSNLSAGRTYSPGNFTLPSIRSTPLFANAVSTRIDPTPSTRSLVDQGFGPTLLPVSFTIQKTGSTPSSLTIPGTGSSSSPVNLTSQGTNPSPSPVVFTSSGTGSNPSLVNFPVQGKGPTPSPVNFAVQGTGPTPSPVNFTAGPTPSPVIFTNPGTGPSPSPVSFAVQGTGHTPSPVVFTKNPTPSPFIFTTGPTPSPVNVVVQSTGPTPSSVNPISVTSLSSITYTHPYPNNCSPNTISPSFTNGDLVGPNLAPRPSHCPKPALVHSVANGIRPVNGQGVNAGVERSSGADVSSSAALMSSSSSMPETPEVSTVVEQTSNNVSTTGAFSLHASGMLQTLSMLHEKSHRNSCGSLNAPFRDAAQESTENAQDLENGLPNSPLVPEHLNVKEKWPSSRKSSSNSKNIRRVSKDKRIKENISVRKENCCKEALSSENSSTLEESQERNHSTSVTRNQGCSERMKESSAGFSPQTRLTYDSSRKEPSEPRGKKRRNPATQPKGKKSKGSKLAKRSRTKEDSIHFPTDLNVEEFLSKLQYEEK